MDPYPDPNLSPTITTSPVPYKNGLLSKIQNNEIVSFLEKYRHHPIVVRVAPRIFLPFLIFTTFHLIATSISDPTHSSSSDSYYSSTSPLVLLLLLGMGTGELFSLVRLPPLLGMLVVGIILRNLGSDHPGLWSNLDVTRINPNISTLLRQIALVVILIRAGLGLDPVALFRLKGVVLRLAFCPCLAETLAVAIASHFLLNFPWLWAILLGFVLAAVSPAVVVPCLLSLREKGYGVGAGIPTILIAASSVDDILAISGFGLVLAAIFAGGSETDGGGDLFPLLLQGPLELGVGLGFGVIWGSLLGFFFANQDCKGDESPLMVRIILILTSGITALLASQQFDLPGSGPLGCLTATFVASIFWRRAGVLNDTCNLNLAFRFMWYVFQPLLFGLIGTEINLNNLEVSIVVWGILVLFIGLIIRILVTYWVVGGAGLSLKERLFVAVAWIPKATVQAAIGPIALDTQRRLHSSTVNSRSNHEDDLGLGVLTIAILAILVTAPIGSMAITLLGPRLLSSTSSSQKNAKEEDADANTNATENLIV